MSESRCVSARGDDFADDRSRAAVQAVLVATDFSEGADLAVRVAFRLATHHDAHVTVMHVAPRGVHSEILQTADRSLHELIRSAPVSADTVMTTGGASGQITAEAERRQADVVVVGAHGAHWLRDMFLGSTAEMVLATSRIPVLLAKGPDTGSYSTVMLAVDASKCSFRAARAGLAMTPMARHVLAHAVTVLGENLLRLNGADDHAIDELRRSQLAMIRPTVERLADELIPAPNEIIIEPARPETLVSTLAGRCDTDLLVVGVERGSGPRHALVGSVSRHAMQRAPCDVLVVPLEQETSPDTRSDAVGDQPRADTAAEPVGGDAHAHGSGR